MPSPGVPFSQDHIDGVEGYAKDLTLCRDVVGKKMILLGSSYNWISSLDTAPKFNKCYF